MVTREAVLEALSKVQEPELHKDLVTLNMIQNLSVENGNVAFSIILTTPACPLKGRIESEARQAVANLEDVKNVEIKMSASVVADSRDRGEIQLSARNIVAIASGKGGVGKTTVAVNIAVSLAQRGARVGLLDADIYGPNVPTMMGVKRLPLQNSDKITPAVAHGVKVMSIGFLVKPGQPIVWRGPMLHTAIRQFLNDVDWGDLDYLIVDMPPGTGDVQLSLAQLVPLTGGVIVTLPQLVSREDAARGLQMFRELNIPVLGVVENMSYLVLPDGGKMDVFGSGGGKLLSEESGVPLLGQIPMDAVVRIGGDSGLPVVVANSNSLIADAFMQIAEQLAAAISVSVVSQRSQNS